jgi:hypothetical protein
MRHEIIPLAFLYYEDIEKSPYYWKNKHEQWLKTQQAQTEAINARIRSIYLLFIKTSVMCLKTAVWAFAWIVYLWTLGIYYMVSWVIKLAKYLLNKKYPTNNN